MLPETPCRRIRFLLLQPVDAIAFARMAPAADLGGLRAAGVTLLLVNFAAAMLVSHWGGLLAAVPGVGAGLHIVLIYAQRVFDLFAWGMFIYLVILRRS